VGKGHTVTLKSDKTLWVWGYNEFGQLGDGSTTDKNTPIQESTTATNWSSIAAGYYHTVGLKSDGTLWAWGSNGKGSLGDGSNVDKTTPTQESTGETNWSAIAAGASHTVALKSGGTPTPIPNVWDAPSTTGWGLAALVAGMLVVLVLALRLTLGSRPAARP
jgi:alpha-tubulin suppressor-like RCC1 family protein